MIALDPSSTCIGYAIFGCEGARDYELKSAGRITSKPKDKATVRMVKLADEIMDLIDEYDGPRTLIVVEIPSGHVNRGRHGGGGAGLSVYGMAVGYLLGRLASVDVDVRMVLENDWTRGIPKGKRQQWVAARHRCYDASKDAGGDVADAIGLGEWWIMEQKLPAAPPRVAGTGGMGVDL